MNSDRYLLRRTSVQSFRRCSSEGDLPCNMTSHLDSGQKKQTGNLFSGGVRGWCSLTGFPGYPGWPGWPGTPSRPGNPLGPTEPAWPACPFFPAAPLGPMSPVAPSWRRRRGMSGRPRAVRSCRSNDFELNPACKHRATAA